MVDIISWIMSMRPVGVGTAIRMTRTRTKSGMLSCVEAMSKSRSSVIDMNERVSIG